MSSNSSAANSSANNTASGDPSKVSGQMHSVKGTAVETLGNLTGMSSMQQSGKDEHSAGESEYKAAQAKAYGEGVADRVAGKKDTVVGAVTGDRAQEASGNVRHDAGQTKQQTNA